MKSNKFIINIAVILTTTLLLASCGKEPSIVGKWSSEGNKMVTTKGHDAIATFNIELKEDGTGTWGQVMTFPKYPGQQDKRGPEAFSSWELSEDGKTLTVDKEEFQIVELTDGTFIWKKGDEYKNFNDKGELTFKRVESFSD